MKTRHVAAALGAIAILTACGLMKSPAEDINFVAPSGWQSTPGIMGALSTLDRRRERKAGADADEASAGREDRSVV